MMQGAFWRHTDSLLWVLKIYFSHESFAIMFDMRIMDYLHSGEPLHNNINSN